MSPCLHTVSPVRHMSAVTKRRYNIQKLFALTSLWTWFEIYTYIYENTHTWTWNGFGNTPPPPKNAPNGTPHVPKGHLKRGSKRHPRASKGTQVCLSGAQECLGPPKRIFGIAQNPFGRINLQFVGISNTHLNQVTPPSPFPTKMVEICPDESALRWHPLATST